MLEGALGGAKDMAIKWGVPLAGLAIGYMAGNTITYRLNGLFDQAGFGAQIQKYTKVANVWQIYYLIDAGIFASVGIAAHKMMQGVVGKAIAFIFYGMALSAAVSAMSGYNPGA